MEKVYLLQGVFFQGVWNPQLAYKPDFGLDVIIEKGVDYTMYQAIVGPENNTANTFSGMMSDRYGYSVINDVQMSETELKFTKYYTRRPPIEYSFKEKIGEMWIGTYGGPDCGRGIARCIVTEVDASFLFLEKETYLRLLQELDDTDCPWF
jgi:hypothetical protein